MFGGGDFSLPPIAINSLPRNLRYYVADITAPKNKKACIFTYLQEERKSLIEGQKQPNSSLIEGYFVYLLRFYAAFTLKNNTKYD